MAINKNKERIAQLQAEFARLVDKKASLLKQLRDTTDEIQKVNNEITNSEGWR